MNLRPVDIDRIVNEVVMRLRGTSSEVETKGSGSVSGMSPSKAELDVSERVVTLASIEGRLGGVRRITVPPGAVVTPAVRDELNELGISLEHRAMPEESNSPLGLVLSAWETDFQPAQLIQRLVAAGVEARCGKILPSVTSLEEDVAKNATSRVVLFTDKPSLAVFRFTDRPRVRTAWVIDRESIESSVECLGPNLLVLEPVRHTIKQLVDMVKQYATLPCHCPSSFLSS